MSATTAARPPRILRRYFFRDPAFSHFAQAKAWYWAWRHAKSEGITKKSYLKTLRVEMRDAARRASQEVKWIAKTDR